jgi:thymidine phosphorylase
VALLTDMSQPLGRWVGHAAEVEEALACLAGEGPPDLLELTCRLAEELAALLGAPVRRQELAAAIDSGAARERFTAWAARQGADRGWLARPLLPRAPAEVVVRSPRSGVVAAVDAERLGVLLADAGGGRARPGDAIDPGIALASEVRLGDAVEAGQPLARFYLRREDPGLERRAAACYRVAGAGEPPPLIYERLT